MSKNKIVFMGTPKFALFVLKKIYYSKHELVAIVTRSDKKKDRGHDVKFSPVKEFALEKNILLLQPENLKDDLFLRELKNFDADYFIVAAYGRILSKQILEIPNKFCINVHASILPKFRGASPIQHAILSGEKKTGITLMRMDAGMDTGDIIRQKEIDIKKDDNFDELYEKLAILGSEMLINILDNDKNIFFTKQNDILASYAPVIKKSDSEIDFSKTNLEILNLIRAMNPKPGAFFLYNKKILKIFEAEEFNDLNKLNSNLKSNYIFVINKKKLVAKTADGYISIKKIQEPGKKIINIQEYLAAHKDDFINLK
ncbi:MAG: methionyl-tRNA formyltransferase [Clostridiales bacterium]|jgi:methionyl-tRNA formyltransferase|nr:methionyl-tRNA formyltransferase [Clostridiales bacterium]